MVTKTAGDRPADTEFLIVGCPTDLDEHLLGKMMETTLCTRIAVAALTILSMTWAAHAQSTSFLGPANGSWDLPGNWTAGVPTSTVDAIIKGWSVQHGAGVANAADVYVGYDGSPASLICEASGPAGTTFQFHAKDVYVGYDQFGDGTMSVDGSIYDTFQTNNISLGHLAGSHGTLDARANFLFGISVKSSDTLTVGRQGQGELNVFPFASATSSETIIGQESGSTGTVTLTRGILQAESQLQVGVLGTGMLDIQGGVAISSSVSVGVGSGSSGTIHLVPGMSGGNSALTASGFMEIGGQGEGTLMVQGENSSVTSGIASIGVTGVFLSAPASVGIVTITDNAQWDSDEVYVGGTSARFLLPFGRGTVNVTNGGSVDVTGVLKIWEDGTINLDGGTITTGSFERISPGTFNHNDGTLTVNGGSFLSNAGGTLTVQASASTKTSALVLQDLSNTPNYGTISIGIPPDRYGSMTLGGGTEINSANLFVGGSTSSSGVLEIQGGSTASAASSIVGGGGTLKIGLDDSQTPKAGKLEVSGALTLLNAALEVTEEESPSGAVYVIASYGSLSGTFASVNIGPGWTLDYNYLGGKQIALISNIDVYGDWTTSHITSIDALAPTGFGDDAEGDGMQNGLEWILGGDPMAQDAGGLITTTGDPTSGLTLTFSREPDSLNRSTLELQWDTDLDGVWSDTIEIGETSSSEANGVEITVIPGAPDSVSVNIPASNAVDGGIFARLRATKL